MQIRPATTADVSAVLPMADQICALHESWDRAKFGFVPNLAEHYRNWLTTHIRNDRSVFLVADPGGTTHDSQLAGFLVGTIETELPIYRLSEYGFIHDIWVEPEFRHDGVGRQLLEAARQAFMKMQVQQIRLDTAQANESARRLFQSCGFRVSTIELLADLTQSDEPPPDAKADSGHRQT